MNTINKIFANYLESEIKCLDLELGKFNIKNPDYDYSIIIQSYNEYFKEIVNGKIPDEIILLLEKRKKSFLGFLERNNLDIETLILFER